MPLTLQWKTDDMHKSIIKIEKKYKKAIDVSTRVGADYVAQDIKNGWSATSPSREGARPAIDTGNLDSSIKVERTGRDELGRYADANNTKAHYVSMDTSKGSDPRGRGQYTQALEEGTFRMGARPFIQNAMNRGMRIYKADLKRRLS